MHTSVVNQCLSWFTSSHCIVLCSFIYSPLSAWNLNTFEISCEVISLNKPHRLNFSLPNILSIPYSDDRWTFSCGPILNQIAILWCLVPWVRRYASSWWPWFWSITEFIIIYILCITYVLQVTYYKLLLRYINTPKVGVAMTVRVMLCC